MTDTTNDLGTSNDISILGKILQTDELKKYEEKMREFNPFAALRLKDYEIRHTNALAWLLDDEGSHGLKSNFLEKFLKKVRTIAQDRNIKSDFSSKGMSITVEDAFLDNHDNRRGPNRLDIWLEGNDWVIAIEAKINSKEGKNQLGNYFDEIENRFANWDDSTRKTKKKILLFLTVDKMMPGKQLSEDTLASDKYKDWIAVSWLNLVAESLVEALVEQDKFITPETATYEQRFLFSYLDVIYEKSAKEFRDNGPVNAISDRAKRDEYLVQVSELIENEEPYKLSLIALKDHYESSSRTIKLSGSKKTPWERSCAELEEEIKKLLDPNELMSVKNFQSTFEFLLAQVDSTIEGRMRLIKDAIHVVKDEYGEGFEILRSSFCSISFIPKIWLQDEYLQRGWLIFYVQYKKEWENKPTKIEFKLYFPSRNGPEAKKLRINLWEHLKVQNGTFSATDDRITKEEVKIITSGPIDVSEFSNTLSTFNNMLNERFIPAIRLVSEAAAKVPALQS